MRRQALVGTIAHGIVPPGGHAGELRHVLIPAEGLVVLPTESLGTVLANRGEGFPIGQFLGEEGTRRAYRLEENGEFTEIELQDPIQHDGSTPMQPGSTSAATPAASIPAPGSHMPTSQAPQDWVPFYFRDPMQHEPPVQNQPMPPTEGLHNMVNHTRDLNGDLQHKVAGLERQLGTFEQEIAAHRATIMARDDEAVHLRGEIDRLQGLLAQQQQSAMHQAPMQPHLPMPGPPPSTPPMMSAQHPPPGFAPVMVQPMWHPIQTLQPVYEPPVVHHPRPEGYVPTYPSVHDTAPPAWQSMPAMAPVPPVPTPTPPMPTPVPPMASSGPSSSRDPIPGLAATLASMPPAERAASESMIYNLLQLLPSSQPRLWLYCTPPYLNLNMLNPT